MLLNTGRRPIASDNNLLTTVGWGIGDEVTYCLEGSVFIAGAVVQWLRDGLGVIDRSTDVEQLARSVPDAGGVWFVPAFVGLGAPYWDPYARGTILGVTRGTSAAHLARAALEAIAYQTRDLVEAMQKDTGTPLRVLKADGGASVNNLLMQFQADVLGVEVRRPVVAETTALGAAYLAGLAVGYWQDTDELARRWALGECFQPQIPAQKREALYAGWQRAVKRSFDWEQPATQP
jgi:glycerol kinase